MLEVEILPAESFGSQGLESSQGRVDDGQVGGGGSALRLIE